MELEQIQAQIELKEIAQEVRQAPTSSEIARQKLVSPSAATNSDGRYRKDQSMKLSNLRSDAIFGAARAYAAQAALAWRYEQINELVLNKWAGALDKAASFRPFIEQEFILIPSVHEGTSDEQLKDGVLTRLDASFIVDEEAVIVTAAPTFRDYLVREFSAPADLHSALLPASAAEQILWDKGSQEGWEIGVAQAEEVFNDGFNEMEMDIIGRVTYLKLKSLNMISDASLKMTSSGVTFNGRAMNVGEEIFTIDDIARYRTMTDWRTAWSVPSELVNPGGEGEQ